MAKDVGQIMGSASWLAALTLVAAAGGSCSRIPEVIQFDSNIVEVVVGGRTRIDPPPVLSYSTVTFAVDAPDSIRALAVAHGIYGQLRVAPAGPYYVLDSDKLSAGTGDRFRCQVRLALNGSGGRTTDVALRGMIDCRQTLEVQLRVFDGSKVVAESGWMDATGLLASIRGQLR